MPMRLEGSCRCGAVHFALASHTPYPYQRCYCSICRKSAGGGGYAVNIMGVADTLAVRGRRAIRIWHAMIDGSEGSAARHFCRHCGTPLWVSDAHWPDLVLFAVANLARKLEVEPETALRNATAKFERRFRRVEELARERRVGLDLDALEALWQQVKSAEK